MNEFDDCPRLPLCTESSATRAPVSPRREEPYHPSSGGDQPSEHLLHLLWQRQDLLRQPLMTLGHQSIDRLSARALEPQ